MADLIDTTEMYLKTILELEEDGVTPLRARIVDRLGHSGPTVSQTVARMERDGLLHVMGDRRLELTETGRAHATEVLRKHRLAERLLLDVIGMEWAQVHDEACRWEHVMSDHVERRILDMLNQPKFSPYGNAIPGLEELGIDSEKNDERTVPMALAARESGPEDRFTISRFPESIQTDIDLLKVLADAGITFGASVSVVGGDNNDVIVRADGEDASISLDLDVANAIVVKRASAL